MRSQKVCYIPKERQLPVNVPSLSYDAALVLLSVLGAEAALVLGRMLPCLRHAFTTGGFSAFWAFSFARVDYFLYLACGVVCLVYLYLFLACLARAQVCVVSKVHRMSVCFAASRLKLFCI